MQLLWGYDQGHREFPFRKWKIPPVQRKIPENSRRLKRLIVHRYKRHLSLKSQKRVVLFIMKKSIY